MRFVYFCLEFNSGVSDGQVNLPAYLTAAVSLHFFRCGAPVSGEETVWKRHKHAGSDPERVPRVYPQLLPQ